MLSESQLKFITDVLITIGEISLASLVIPYFSGSGLQPAAFIWGMTATVDAWIFGLVMSYYIKN